MMKLKITAIIFMFFLLVPAVAAQTPSPGGGAIEVTPDTLPYTFTPYTYTTSGHLDQLDVFQNPAFVNPMGSTALTLFSILDSQNVLGIFVVLLIGIFFLWRIFKFTTTATPNTDGIDLNFEDNPYKRG